MENTTTEAALSALPTPARRSLVRVAGICLGLTVVAALASAALALGLTGLGRADRVRAFLYFFSVIAVAMALVLGARVTKREDADRSARTSIAAARERLSEIDEFVRAIEQHRQLSAEEVEIILSRYRRALSPETGASGALTSVKMRRHDRREGGESTL